MILDSAKYDDEQSSFGEADSDIVHKGVGGHKISLTDEQVMAQSFIFLIAGNKILQL